MLCSLLAVSGLLFGGVSTLSAAEAADSMSQPEQLSDSAATLVAAADPNRTESLLQALDQRMTGLEQTLERVSWNTGEPSGFDFDGNRLTAILIVLISVGGAVTALFFVLRFRYLARKRRYELEISAMERGVWPENERRELPLTTFVRRLLVVGIVAFGTLSWIGLANLGYMRFFPSALLWALIGGLGYAVVYLFRLYVRRRDAEGR